MPSNDSRFRSRRLFLFCGYAALAAGFLLVVVLPYTRSATAVRRDIERYQLGIASRVDRAHQLQDINRNIQLMDLETRNYDRLVPANQDLGRFLSELSVELDRAGMSDVSVSAMTATPLGKTQKLPIEVRGRGSYAQFHEFLARLENLQRKSSVGKLSIDADTDMNGYISAQLTLYIYNTKPRS
jgi:Tfp pilus assembly protein PilO